MKRSLLFLVILVLLLAGCAEKKLPVTPDTALSSYLSTNDDAYFWETKESYDYEGLKVYGIKLTSQVWRDIKWTHQLAVIVPPEINSNSALLFITGGSNKDSEPNWKDKNDGLLKMLAVLAAKNKAIVAILRQVPNQPLYGDLTEDALITYTLDKFKADRDFTWPLLFPMVKSAISAMNCVQEFSAKDLNKPIEHFVISGASKRGWTTWLTGSQDKRVIAIAPMVIDVLNMPVNVEYQKKVWGDYSVEIQDYVRLGIAQSLSTPEGSELATMIDPYSYRETLTMPKLVFMGTSDPYWPADAVKNYLPEIPGDNHIHYEPNVGHDLGDGVNAMKALSAFFNLSIYGKPVPVCKWIAGSDSTGIEITVTASPELITANLWMADSPDQDFRNETYAATPVKYRDPAEIVVKIDYPATGYRAFYLELVYPDPVEGQYSITTRMFVANTTTLFLD